MWTTTSRRVAQSQTSSSPRRARSTVADMTSDMAGSISDTSIRIAAEQGPCGGRRPFLSAAPAPTAGPRTLVLCIGLWALSNVAKDLYDDWKKQPAKVKVTRDLNILARIFLLFSSIRRHVQVLRILHISLTDL